MPSLDLCYKIELYIDPVDGLWKPESLIEADETQINAVVNGCGAANAKFDFVPDHLRIFRLFSVKFLNKIPYLRVYIGEACRVHDWMYHEGKDWVDKLIADLVFLVNMTIIIDRIKGKLKVWQRVRFRKLATEYYGMVWWRGDDAFKEKKHWLEAG